MSQSQYGALRVRAKTGEVVAYHQDKEQPGKPLHLLIPGGLIALTSLFTMIWIAHATWYQASLPQGRGLICLLLLAPVYAGSVFVFSYGYELYDVPKALRLTAILVFISLAAVIIFAVLFALLGKSGADSSSTSDDSDSSSGSGTSFSGSRSRQSWGGGGSIDIDLGGSQTVTREVVREVPVEPALVTCSYCGAAYLPTGGILACASCGAARVQEAGPS